MSNQKFKFSDDLIGQISKLLQVALLTGTDIIDHLRMLEVTPGEETLLEMSPEYKTLFDGQIDSMMAEVEKFAAQMESDVDAI